MRVIILLFCLWPLSVILADQTPLVSNNHLAPVEQATPAADTQQLSNQVQFLQKLNLPQRMQSMQGTIQDLRGIIAMQGHEITELKKQQHTLYSDLDNRLTQSQPSTTTVKNAANGVKVPTAQPAVSTAEQPSPTKTTGEKVQSGIAAAVQPQKQPATQLPASAEEMLAYQAAFPFIKQKKYSQAIQKFQDYLNKYPSGKYVGDAQYWLGELYAISGDDQSAMRSFNNLIDNYPASEKAANALLQIGALQYAKGNYDSAKRYWSRLIADPNYQKSAAARVAKKRMKDLAKAGR